MTVADTISHAQSAFRGRYHRDADFGAAAPGRVNLIGGHVDYNDGFVLPMAIDRYTVLLACQNKGHVARFFSSQLDETFEFDLTRRLVPGELGHWGNYVLGVVSGFLETGVELPGFDALIHSSVPTGGGLSSSAALEVGVATLLERMADLSLDKSHKALLCHQAENEFAGVPCGIMDPFASVFGEKGRLVKIDCRSREVELIDWPDGQVTVLIINSNAPHQLVDGAYAERKYQASQALRKLEVDSYRELSLEQLEAGRTRLDAIEFRRARHVVTELMRAEACASMIQTGNWDKAGQQLYQSHDSLRDDYEVSCRELDLLVETGKEIGRTGGVFGARMTGGGFGGCVVLLVRTADVEEIAASIQTRYQIETGIEASSFSSSPARGAFAFVP